MRFIVICILLCASLMAYETTVVSDEARYDGELITLTGHVAVENAMGTVTAELAILKKDSAQISKMDFPWIELQRHVRLNLAKGGVLECETLLIDYTTMSSLIFGDPQVIFRDGMGEVHADRARIDYREINGTIEATKVTLYNNVRLVNLGTDGKQASQYALADEVHYLPSEQVMMLEGKQSRVLFYDAASDMQLSARSVKAFRDPKTKKESVQGIGDVKFVFGPEELEKIKTRFQIK